MIFKTKAYVVVNLLAHNPDVRFRFYKSDAHHKLYTAVAKQMGPRHKRTIEVEDLDGNRTFETGVVGLLKHLGENNWYTVVENI